MVPWSERTYDVIIWGATGFTGSLATAAMAGHTAPFFSCKLPNAGHQRAGVKRWAIAGRSEAKLRKLHSECGCSADVDIIVAEADNVENISAFVANAKVVIATAGPFKQFSDVVVGQCAALGTHYVDITGEAAWVRSVIDRFDGLARANGAIICNMCGFDSIPFDLGALFAINRLKASKSGTSIRRVRAYLLNSSGGFSGGSLATGVSNEKTPVQLTGGVNQADPFLLGGIPKGGPREEDMDLSLCKVHKLGADIFCGPSVMHNVNSRCVRRSAQLLSWGPHFNYTELSPVPSAKVAEKLVAQMRNPAPPEVIERLMAEGKLPKPGEGPKPEVRKVSRFVSIIECQADDGSELVATMRGGEGGYEETARMVLEAALTLLQEPHSCPGVATGGCLTPAAALGEPLIRRLSEIGMPFAVESKDAAAVAREAMVRPAKL